MLDLSNVLGLKIISKPWNNTAGLPHFLVDIYYFQNVSIEDTNCLFACPKNDIPAIQAIKKHFETINAIVAVPIVLKLNGLSGDRRKVLINNRVPFVSSNQIYLPFLGVILQEQIYSEPKSREKLMPSSQMLFFALLYQSYNKMQTNSMPEKLGISAMQITRAVRQLQRLNLIECSKEGVNVVISGKLNFYSLFETASPYLIDPVKEITFIPRNTQEKKLPYSGISALSEMSMINPSNVPTFAYYNKKEKILGENGLIDRENQVRIEIWKYSPTLLSAHKGIADPLSVITSLRNEQDDVRVEQAIEEVLNKLWR
jgi:hypothetical protein